MPGRHSRVSDNISNLNVLHNASVHGGLETGILLTSKVPKLGVLGTALARLVGGRASDGAAHVHGLVGGGQEDDLAVGRLGHGLHGLEVADLHGGRGAQNVGGLAHQLGGFDLEGSTSY